MTTISTQQLSIGYRKSNNNKVVQSNINIDLTEGEIISLIGPNGCGKSTLIRTLAGLQAPLLGSVIVQNQSISKLSSREKAKKIALVLTEKLQIEYAKVIDIVRLGQIPHTKWYGKLSNVANKLIENALDTVQIYDKKNQYIHELSDGERQRVLIAKALAQDTPIILLDEPTAHLDLPSRITTIKLLTRLAKEKQKTIILSTHEIELALQMTDRIGLMQKGKSIVMDTPEEIIKNQQINHAFDTHTFHISKQYQITYSTST